MLDAFSIAAKLMLDSKDFEKGLTKGESGFRKFGNKLEKGFKTVAKIGTATVGVLSASLVPLTKNMVKSYADYEQLVGGVQTLFKEAAVFVQQDADKAFETTGMSANKYMEMATSFAASLVQGLGGNTMLAADYANKAIIDMSDNANKMGTDIESIENAYRGFSKQNFTMLDNLKLGYGGTKTEMERLLSDAEKLTGQKYDVSNFADIVDAIHAIQVNMDVAGTTAKEASTTITGSFKAMQASWENVLVAMADPKGDVKKATANLVNAGKTMLKNVLPIVETAISGLGDFIADVAPTIGEYLPELLSNFVPKFLKAGKNLAIGLGKGIFEGIKKFKWPTWGEVKSAVQTGWDTIKNGVAKLGGLIFGEDEEGNVNWPDFSTAVQWAKENIWDGIIVKGVSEFGGLIFGKDEEGNVNWPDDFGEALSWAETNIWEGIIKPGIGELGGLIFGKKENGEVNWPENFSEAISWAKENVWDKYVVKGVGEFGGLIFGKNEKGEVNWPTPLSSAFSEALQWAKDNIWDGVIKPGIGEFGGLLFGKKEDGSVNWPEDFDATIAWAREHIWDGIIKKGIEGFGGLVFGADEEGKVNWPSVDSVRKSAQKFWTGEDGKGGVVGAVSDIFKFFFSVDNPDAEDQADELGRWWSEEVVPLMGKLLDYTLALFGLPDAKEMADSINEWFGEVATKISTVPVRLFDNIFGTNYAEQLIELGRKADEERAMQQAELETTTDISQSLEAIEKVKNGMEELDGTEATTTINTVITPATVMNPKYLRNKQPGTANPNWLSDGENAKGNWDVPFDNYQALLHRNEMVLTASQARQYREGNAGGSNNNAVIDAVNGLRSTLANLSIEVSGRTFGKTVVDYSGGRMRNYIGNSNKRQMAGFGTR